MEISDDRTSDFRRALGTSEEPANRARVAPDRFHFECNLAAQQLHSLGNFVERISPDYVDVRGTSKMSDDERNRIDQELKASLSSARSKIHSIRETFLAENPDQSQPESDLATNFASRLSSQELQHCESVIQILLQLLHQVGQHVKRKRKDRLAHVVRQLQLKASSFTTSTSSEPVKWAAIVADDDDDGAASAGNQNGQDLDDDDLEDLLQEQVAMQNNHQSEMDEIRQCQRRLAEIGEMMVEFTTHLAAQSEVVADIEHNAEEAVEEIEQANDYLRRTVESSATFRMVMLVFFLGTSFLLLAYEWVSS